jgi:Na+/proline symporter
MALFGVPIVIPSVFGILWRRPNTKGVYLCIAMGVVSGILLKTCWKGLSWEAGTFVQVGVCFVGFFGGAFFGTAKCEEESREGLFKEIDLRNKDHGRKCPT